MADDIGPSIVTHPSAIVQEEEVAQDPEPTYLEVLLEEVVAAQAKVGNVETQNTRKRNDAILMLLAALVEYVDG